MRQFEYLNELKENIVGKLPPDMIKDILSDYESFFVYGREEGKSDDEISAELGSPAFLAKSLLESQEELQAAPLSKHIANPGRRLCAYFIDAVIAVLPAFIVTYILGAAILSYMLLITYPSPFIGALTYLSYSTYQELTVESAGPQNTVPILEVLQANKDERMKIRPQNTVPILEDDEQREHNSQAPTPASIIFAVFALVFYMLYSLVSTLILKGQTIGKKLMHIKVRHSNNDPVNKSRIFSREFLGKLLINSIPIVPFVSIFTILLTREHKALHDMLADTIVVEV